MELPTKKNKWNDEMMQEINWSGLEKALLSYQPFYSTKIMQLMHDWQYVGERKLLMNDNDGNCPMQCGCLETKLHYLYCNDTTVKTKRNAYLQLLTKQLHAINTYPGIVTCFTKILTQGYQPEWMKDILPTNKLDNLMHQAIHTQQALGLHSLPKGYLNITWEKAQNQWTSTNHSSQPKHDWKKHAVISLHNYTYSTWKARNDILHQHATKSAKAIKKQALQARITDLYQRGRANLKPRELGYFKLPLEQRIHKGTESMTLWIHLVEATFKLRGQARQEKLDTWLTGITPEKNWKDRKKMKKL